MVAFQTHQQIELPPIEMEVTHWVLNKCRCPKCGRTVKAALPNESRTGYGPRLSAFIAELSGTKAMSRNNVKELCHSVLGIDISAGAIQKVIDRSSAAIEPAYQQIGQVARSAECNYIDETSWFKNNALQWLWAMVNEQVAFYRIDPHRSKKAFEALIEDWRGILISDSYGLYRSWANDRQSCLAHLIRKAKGLSQRNKPDLKRFGNIRPLLYKGFPILPKPHRIKTSGPNFIGTCSLPFRFMKTTQTMRGNYLGRFCVKSIPCGPFSTMKKLSQPITVPNEPCALACYGGSAVLELRVKKVIAGSNASYR